MRRLLPAIAAAAVPVSSAAATAETAQSSAPAGEYGNQCAMGLAVGMKVATDCSIRWEAPSGKVYCFGSEEARKGFLVAPEENLQKAEANYEKPNSQTQHTKDFTEADAIAAVKAEIEARTRDGVFVFYDPKLGSDLRLVFDEVRLVRGMHGYGWFPNVVFHEAAEPKKKYAIDFWLKPDGDKLSTVDIRVQKGPKREGDGWIMMTRLPVAWWWLPVSEHPGDMEVVRHWHVMSAIHSEIAKQRDKDGVIILKDEKTGQSIPLEFVEIHQPVRRLQGDGRFFACTDFRKKGSKDAYYDVDFWLDDKDGKLKVRDVKIHKVPVQEDGIWIQKFRYTFDGLDSEDVK